MSNEYLRLNDTKLNIKKAENLLAIIESKRKDPDEIKEMQSEDSLFSEVYKAFKNFFSRLGKPTVQKRLQKKESPAKSSDYNKTMREIYDDIHVAYSEEDALSSAIVKNFNYSESERQLLLNSVKKISSKSLDYSFYSTGAKSKSLFGIDSFTDNSKIDFDKMMGQAAEVVVNQGVITLKRTGNIDRAPTVSKITGIQESIPEWKATAQTGGYEGMYFGIKNEARPEGGKWHIQYASDGKTLIDAGASEAELMPIRFKMFDNNPDTFWEVEYVTNPVVGYKNKYSGQQISVAEFNDLVANEIDSPNVEVTGDTIVTDEYGRLIEDYIPVTQGAAADYLTVNFTVFLNQVQNINWISLNPNNFGQELYMDILSIQTSPDGQVFTELEGFDDYEYDITLTQEANQELAPSMVRDTLSPDRFKFAGQGIWVFSPRRVKAIRFTVRQTRSYLKKYEVLMIETEQTRTTTTTKKEWWGGNETVGHDVQVIKRQIQIPYLDGLINGLDVLDLEPGGDLGSEQKSWNWWPWGSSKKVETSVSPETISRQWTVIKDDKARFAIGIRDINIYSYKFAEVSEVVSKPYTSPKPIAKVAITVDEQIPKVFYTASGQEGTDNNWIKYYISADNGVSWYRIAPTHHRTIISEDGTNNVPEIININSDIDVDERDNPLAYIDAGVAVHSVRFKAVLSRPTTITDAESYTPVLSKYALQIYPHGGL